MALRDPFKSKSDEELAQEIAELRAELRKAEAEGELAAVEEKAASVLGSAA